MKRNTLGSKQSLFLERTGSEAPFYALFEQLPGVAFFARNDQFELVCANSAFLERFGFASIYCPKFSHAWNYQ